MYVENIGEKNYFILRRSLISSCLSVLIKDKERSRIRIPWTDSSRLQSLEYENRSVIIFCKFLNLLNLMCMYNI